MRRTNVRGCGGGGCLLHFTRRWLACHAEIAALIGGLEREDAAEVRAILSAVS